MNQHSGQSILEFIFLLPILILMPMVIVKISAAIQISIVNQQYARAHTLFLAFNSPIYPELKWRTKDLSTDSFMKQESDEMIIGLSHEIVPENDFKRVVAPTQQISRSGQEMGSNDPQTLPERRGNVRIRTTVSLCTQPNSIRTSNGIQPFHSYALSEEMRLSYCRRGRL